jgi:hypothetical protein
MGTRVGEGEVGSHPDDRGDAIRLTRARGRPTVLGLYYWGGPIVILIAVLLIGTVWDVPSSVNYVLVVLPISSLMFAVYLHSNIRPEAALVLGADSVRLYVDGELVREVTFGSLAEVDIHLNESTRSDEYGGLWGFVFRRGEAEISVSPRGNWDLWDIQSLRDPVLELVDRHRMRMGEDMRRYVNELAREKVNVNDFEVD